MELIADFQEKLSSLHALGSQRVRLSQELLSVETTEKRCAAELARELVEKFQLTTVEVGLVRPQKIKAARDGKPTFAVKTPKASVPPRYRDPESGATWSGRGMPPRWIVSQNRDDFLIDGTTD